MSAPSATGRTVPNRERVTTIADDGSRIFLHPADVSGLFTRWRTVFGWFLIALFFALPWIEIAGHPAIFLDLAERRFHIFGITFAAQDVPLMFFVLVGIGITGFLITSLWGRLWCGWSCPHTVFLEHVFRRIERWIDGDAAARRKLDAADWTPEKITKRVVKWGIFAIISLILFYGVLAYFVSIPGLYQLITHAPWENWPTFVFMVVATLIVFFNFTWFREQLCLVICPYGRLQSALQDDDTLLIGYDARRGEPRGKVGTLGAGDCVSCNRCVQVCPTGIDIRQGFQIECVGCANCIDACDAVMTKLGRPKGLIRYDSLNGLNGGKRRLLRPRIGIYAAVILILGSVAGYAFSRVEPAHIVIQRMGGAPYFVDDSGVRNQFLVRFVNKTSEPMMIGINDEKLPAGMSLVVSERGFEIPPLAEIQIPMVFVAEKSSFPRQAKLPVDFYAEAGMKVAIISRRFDFVGPRYKLKTATSQNGT